MTRIDIAAADITEEIARRPDRAPDHALEARMVSVLADELAERPDTVLSHLAACLVEAGIGGSAGVTVCDGEQGIWEAVSGAWRGQLGAAIPMPHSPCGLTVERDAPILMARPADVFPNMPGDPAAAELLIVPFRLDGTPAGTLWVVSHDAARRFDGEDLRLLERLARFAASAQRARERARALARSRDLLQGTMDASVDMIQVFEAVRDEAGEIVDFRWLLNNHTSESRFGKVEGQSLLERNPGVVIEGIFDIFKCVTETGKPSLREHHYIHEQFNGWFLQSVTRLNDGVATTTKDITEWKHAQAELIRLRDEAANDRLRRSEDRFRQFGEASQDVLWIRDAATLQWEYLTPAFQTLYGIPVALAMLTPGLSRWLDRVVPGDREHARAHIERAQGGGSTKFEYRVHHPDGEDRWVRTTAFPMPGADGSIERIGGIDQDITRIKRAQHELEESEERLRSATEVGRLGLWDWNVRTGHVTWSDEHFRMQGYGVGEVVPSYKAWVAGIHPEDRTATVAALEAAMTNRTEYVHEFRSRHRDGSIRWIAARGRFSYNERGEPERMVGAAIDLTERREAEERQRLLLGELQHRVRNILAVVRSIVRRTHDQGQTAEEFVQHLEGRLGALARTQVLLTGAVDAGADLEMILRDELATQATDFDRVKLEGPTVRLPGKQAEVLTLAIHELATNAMKYGAFAHADGQLAVRWTLHVDTGQPWLRLEWHESGVDMPWGQDKREGFGTELITRRVPYELRGKGRIELLHDGIECTLDIPLVARPSILSGGDPGRISDQG
ncbi:hypothetical protein COC42_15295 [Sphingomonas spermidinifaciens]|uniref:histidine kinase n=1 Tax=Sphingomonas spermidinifaciens TaxID=1141889 RepID=A0A2A4B3T9_9SPHN|nr:PAS domain-containing protein [Sphingomonas spermidinifaciens]PCD02740.1 hypothetical protein COC42_15295 [Sphingomonas spermidinifaciens]